MKLAIMQPYLFPYIGYFQLMNEVDEFVVYDNIKFTKKGWINRNRILVNGKESYITIPLKKDSDYLDVRDRYLAESWIFEKNKLLNRIIESYRKAPHFNSVYPVIETCLLYSEKNLFSFLLYSLALIKEFLGIQTTLLISSAVQVDHDLKAGEKVVEICRARKADIYVNPIGGIKLYSKDSFKNENISLYFIKMHEITYKQFDNDFIPNLSIIDVMMFNEIGKIKEYLTYFYTLI
jgi:hypothetical protein